MNFYILTLIISGSNGDWLGRVAPLRIQILSFSCSFRQNNRLGHPLWELVPAPPPGKSWIRHGRPHSLCQLIDFI